MSPSPGLRNKGQSLVDQITDKRHTDNLDQPRERAAAHSARHATRWEEAAHTLEARANQVRIDSERSAHLDHFAKDVQRGVASPPVATSIPTRRAAAVAYLPPRYWLGYCMTCEVEMWTDTAAPRVPICVQCSHVAPKPKQARR